jgi:predicted NAD/FAD-binding protein
MEPRIVKVAVVGTGLAGLTAAYLLSQTQPAAHAKIEVHVFERVWAILLWPFVSESYVL